MAFSNHSVDKNSPIPLYFQLKKIILSELKNGTLKTNDKLPTEAELCDMYGLSRTTVRQAISELVTSGHLFKEKNRGVYVSAPRAKIDSLYATHYCNEEAKNSGFTLTCAIPTMGFIPATEDVAKALQIKPGDEVIYVEKWCYANDIPVCISNYYFISPLCTCVMDEEAYHHYSAYELLNRQPDTKIGRIAKTITAYSASPEEAKQFNIAIGASLIQADDIGYAANTGFPISYEHVRMVGSRTYITWDFNSDSVVH